MLVGASVVPGFLAIAHSGLILAQSGTVSRGFRGFLLDPTSRLVCCLSALMFGSWCGVRGVPDRVGARGWVGVLTTGAQRQALPTPLPHWGFPLPSQHCACVAFNEQLNPGRLRMGVGPRYRPRTPFRRPRASGFGGSCHHAAGAVRPLGPGLYRPSRVGRPQVRPTQTRRCQHGQRPRTRHWGSVPLAPLRCEASEPVSVGGAVLVLCRASGRAAFLVAPRTCRNVAGHLRCRNSSRRGEGLCELVGMG